MLLELGDELLGEGLSSEERGALEQILYARRRGYHLLLGSRELFRSLGDVAGLSTRAREMLTKAGEQQTMKKDLRHAVTHRIRIGRGGGCVTRQVDGVSVISVPLRHFVEAERCVRAVVLGENRRDAALAEQMGRWYGQVRQMGTVRMRCRLIGGGGSATAVEFRGYRERGELCICLVDGDVEAPGDSIGDTARLVLRELRQHEAWAHAVVSRCREAENTLPTRLLEVVVAGKQPTMGLVTKLEYLDTGRPASVVRDYCDFKEGTNVAWILDRPDGPVRSFWLDALSRLRSLPDVRDNCVTSEGCRDGDDCACWILRKFPENLLERSVDTLSKMTPENMDRLVCDKTREHWLRAGSVVFSWSCGTGPTVG